MKDISHFGMLHESTVCRIEAVLLVVSIGIHVFYLSSTPLVTVDVN